MAWILQAAAFALFQVLIQHLVAADLVVPHLRGDTLEVMRRVDPYAAGFWVVFGRGDGQVFAFAFEAGDGLL